MEDEIRKILENSKGVEILQDIIIEKIKDVQLTVVCNDNKIHTITLQDFINIKQSELVNSYDDKTNTYDMQIKISCDKYNMIIN